MLSLRTFLSRSFAFAIVGSTFLALSTSCAEPASSGVPVSIPSVWVDCRTSRCKQSWPAGGNTIIKVVFATGDCTSTSTDFGYTITGSTNQISCNVSTGCYGQITSWANQDGAATTIPSGTYNICAHIDYTNDSVLPSSGDSVGSLDSVAVGTTTANQFVTDFFDL